MLLHIIPLSVSVAKIHYVEEIYKLLCLLFAIKKNTKMNWFYLYGLSRCCKFVEIQTLSDIKAIVELYQIRSTKLKLDQYLMGIFFYYFINYTNSTLTKLVLLASNMFQCIRHLSTFFEVDPNIWYRESNHVIVDKF